MRIGIAALTKASSLLAMIHLAAALAVQIDAGREVDYYLGLFAVVTSGMFAWADARLCVGEPTSSDVHPPG